MIYQCPKGHQSTDPDYCDQCGALIGQSKIEKIQHVQDAASYTQTTSTNEICPDCGTPREGNGRFCEVCRHDFQDNKTGAAEVIVAAQKASKPAEDITGAGGTDSSKAFQQTLKPSTDINKSGTQEQLKEPVLKMQKIHEVIKPIEKEIPAVSQRLNITISVDRDKVSSFGGESPIKPDIRDRVFPLDLDENLVGRRSQSRGIYPEIEINDPGVSHRHLKFIKQPDGSFGVLELGSSNGTELNGLVLEPGIITIVKAGDELAIGLWTRLKIEAR